MYWRKKSMLSFLLLFCIFWIADWQIVLAQPPQPGEKKLTFEQVYQSAEPRLLARLPNILEWLDDQSYVEIRKDSVDNKIKHYRIDALSGETTLFMNPQEFIAVLPSQFALNMAVAYDQDFSHLIFDSKNDLYYLDTRNKQFKQLTATPAAEKNPILSPDGKSIAFTRDNNLFALDLASGLEKQLTTDGSQTIYNGWASWVYYEEILERASHYQAFYWSPDGTQIAFLRFDDSPVLQFPIVSADGVHGELEMERYPKAGDPNPKVMLGIVPATGGEIVWADFDADADDYLGWVFWTPDSKTVTCQWLNRDQNDLKIYAIDPATGKKHELYHEKQPTWVEFFEDLYFFKDGSGFLLRSDVDNWRHLYYYDMNGKLKKRLTSGNWAVKSIARVDEKNGTVYFTGDKGESTETQLFYVKLDGSGFRQVTQTAGTHEVEVSPGCSYFIDTYSDTQTPSKKALFKTTGELVRQLGDRKLPAMDEYDLAKVELFRIPIADGYNLPACWYLPPDFDVSKKYPILFTVYGGPAAPSVANAFPYNLVPYYQAQQGIIVITVDHRGSGHFGKAGVAQMYRNLGKWEMHDWIEAVKWLRSQPFVDSTRVGITGGSYGGYATCMALTYGADYFTHGVAEYSVTDWRLYDSIYTERFMDKPEKNPEGYKFGSVLTHADKLKGKLLIVHGTMDDNVHMQNTIQLVDRLTLLNKDFELMLYPNERHGVGFHRNHLNKLTDQFWQREFFGERNKN